jgi:hypothetical protein
VVSGPLRLVAGVWLLAGIWLLASGRYCLTTPIFPILNIECRTRNFE